MGIAQPWRGSTGDQAGDSHHGKGGDRGVEQREIDVLTLATPLSLQEGCQYRLHGVHTGHEIADRQPGLRGASAGSIVRSSPVRLMSPLSA